MQSIVTAINHNETAVIEAGTGVGKTHAFLVPVIEYLENNPSERFVISAHTKAQQDQIKSTLDTILSTRSASFGYAVVKGKGNYLCLSRFLAVADEALEGLNELSRKSSLSVDELRMLERHRACVIWSDVVMMLHVTDRDWEGILDDVPVHVQVSWDQAGEFASAAAHAHGLSRCLECRWSAACHIKRKSAEIKRPWTRLLIVNDALLLSTNPGADEDEELKGNSFKRLARAFSDNLVMDEAHHVEETWRKNEAKTVNSAIFAAIRTHLHALSRMLERIMLRPAERTVTERDNKAYKLFTETYTEHLKQVQKIETALRIFAGEREDGKISPWGGMRRLSWNDASRALVRVLVQQRLFFCQLGEDSPRRVEEVFSRLSQFSYDIVNRSQDTLMEHGQIFVFLQQSLVPAQRQTEADSLAAWAQRYAESPPVSAADKKLLDTWLKGWKVLHGGLYQALDPAILLSLVVRDALREILVASCKLRFAECPSNLDVIGVNDFLVQNLMPRFDRQRIDAPISFAPWFDLPDELGVRLTLADHKAGPDETDEDAADDDNFVRPAKPAARRRANNTLIEVQRFSRDVSRPLSQFFTEYRRCILVSATMGLESIEPRSTLQQRSGEGIPALERIGLARRVLRVINQPTPFDVASNMKIAVPACMPWPSQRSSEAHAAACITELVRLMRLLPHLDEPFAAKMLSLWTSRLGLKAAAALAGGLPGTDPVRIHAQGTSAFKNLVERFIQPGHAVLLGSQTFAEGFDVASHPGLEPAAKSRNPAVLLLINKIPFPAMNDPVHASICAAGDLEDTIISLRRRYLESAQGNLQRAQAREARLAPTVFERYILPLTIRNFKQWTGRLLRKEADRGIVFILDPRIVTKRFGIALLDAIAGPDGRQPGLVVYGQKYAHDLSLYRENLNALLDAASHSGITVSDWKAPDFVGAVAFDELAGISPVLPRFKEERRRQLALWEGPELHERIRTLWGEQAGPGHHGAAVPLRTIHADRSLFRLADALFAPDAVGALADDCSALVALLGKWSLRKDHPAVWQTVVEHLCQRPRPPRLHRLQKKMKDLEIYTSAWIKHAVLKTGSLPPDADRSLLVLVESLNKGLHPVFRYDENGVHIDSQYEVSRTVMENRIPVFFSLPTSFGKSFCYQAPALLGRGLTVVFEPTKILVQDQVTKLEAALPEIQYAVAGLCEDFGDGDEVMARLERGDPTLKLLYLTPKQLSNGGLWLRLAAFPHLERFVFDEYHMSVLWGQSELDPEYGLAWAFAGHCRRRATARGVHRPGVFGFTATASVDLDAVVREDFLPLAVIGQHEVKFRKSQINRPDLKISIEECPSGNFDQRLESLVRIVNEFRPGPERRLLVFCTWAGRGQQAGVIQVAERIKRLPGYVTRPDDIFMYYSNLGLDPDKIENGMRSAVIIVTTEALGMGVDMKNIKGVVVVNIPAGVENLVQFLGRMRAENIHAHDPVPKQAWILQGPEDSLRQTGMDGKIPPDFSLLSSGFNTVQNNNYGSYLLNMYIRPDLSVDGNRKYFARIPWVLAARPWGATILPFDENHRNMFSSPRVLANRGSDVFWQFSGYWLVALSKMAARSSRVVLLWMVPTMHSRLVLRDTLKVLAQIGARGGIAPLAARYTHLIAERTAIIWQHDPGYRYDPALFDKVLAVVLEHVITLTGECEIISIKNCFVGATRDRSLAVRVNALLTDADPAQKNQWGQYVLDAMMFLVDSKIVSVKNINQAPVVLFTHSNAPQFDAWLSWFESHSKRKHWTKLDPESELVAKRVLMEFEGIDDWLLTLPRRSGLYRQNLLDMLQRSGGVPDIFRLDLVASFNPHERAHLEDDYGRPAKS
ncbi:MAG TPA: DEAD/DEAH box helicase [Spirochaetota bacterium]|nr:DEAD/DEAH box helicase [Spirochaetota bacterium]